MTIISKEDVIKIAHMSNIKVHEHELEPLAQQLAAVLSYAARVKEIGGSVEAVSHANINIVREDLAIKTDAQIILAQAPAREANYFVVPSILEQK